jgi:hypothetical protein
MVRALLNGNLPTAPTVALAAARRYRTVLKAPTLSAAARSYLQANLNELERRANDPARLDEEAQRANEQKHSKPRPATRSASMSTPCRTTSGIRTPGLGPHASQSRPQRQRRHHAVPQPDPDDRAPGRTHPATDLPDRRCLGCARRGNLSSPSQTPPTTAAPLARAPDESGSSPTPGFSTRSLGLSASTSMSSTKASSTTTNRGTPLHGRHEQIAWQLRRRALTGPSTAGSEHLTTTLPATPSSNTPPETAEPERDSREYQARENDAVGLLSKPGAAGYGL